MPRYIQALFILTICISSCKKDLLHLQKVQQITTNTTARFNHIRFISPDICLATGGHKFTESVVLRSEDGGYTWTTNSYPDAPKGMYGLGVAPSGKVHLCGFGVILYSEDMGTTWHAVYPNSDLFYQGVAYPVEDTGVYVSTITAEFGAITQFDAGLRKIDEHNYKFGLNDVYMVSPSTGYVIGYGAVLKTTDHRRNWLFQKVNGDNFTCMDIHGEEIWMCGSNGGIYHTTNGGDGWTRVRNGNDITIPRYHLYSIVFKDGMHGWACGENGKLIYTDDAGRHWSEYDNFTHSTLHSIVICPNGDLLVGGEDGALFRVTPK